MTLHLHHIEEPVVTIDAWRLGEQVGWDPVYRENLPEWPDRESFTWWERMMAKLRVLIRRVRR